MDVDFTILEFSGPLDVLLDLIKQNKMNILDIEIEEITKQYLEYLDKMESMNLEVTSNYLVLASELLYIKSKMLLPRDENTIEEVEEDPRSELVNRLLEYQTYKEITKTLKDKEELRHEVYTKLPDDVNNYLEDISYNNDGDINLLVDAFKKFLDRKKSDKPIQTKVTEKEITVSERRKKIKNILSVKRKAYFSELFEDFSREYVVATFLAILEMAKEKELLIRQENTFDEIICEVNDGK